MASGDDADLLSLGHHCAVPSCRQIDFLPFTCDACAQTFCLEHRTYTRHACPKAGATKETEVIVCPLCAKGVRLGGRDPNVVFEEHSRSDGCDPRNYARVHNKPRCPVPGCREKLTTITRYNCARCGQAVCLKHRLAEDHGCADALAARASTQRAGAASSTVSAWLGRVQAAVQTAVAPPQQPAPPRAQSGAGAAAAAAAAARAAVGTQRQQRGGVSAAPRPPSPSLSEQCPQCGARFAGVAQLVAHVEDFHPTRQFVLNPVATQPPVTAAGSGNGEVYRCPHCNRQFSDAVVLLGHAEHCTAGTLARPTVAAGASKPDCTVM